MVKVIGKDERIRMSEEQIKSTYAGKWVFMVQVGLDPLNAVPVVIADDWWEDRESGIYEQLKNDTNSGMTMHMSLLKRFEDMLGQY